jgi:hypothetical protein
MEYRFDRLPWPPTFRPTAIKQAFALENFIVVVQRHARGIEIDVRSLPDSNDTPKQIIDTGGDPTELAISPDATFLAAVVESDLQIWDVSDRSSAGKRQTVEKGITGACHLFFHKGENLELFYFSPEKRHVMALRMYATFPFAQKKWVTDVWHSKTLNQVTSICHCPDPFWVFVSAGECAFRLRKEKVRIGKDDEFVEPLFNAGSPIGFRLSCFQDGNEIFFVRLHSQTQPNGSITYWVMISSADENSSYSITVDGRLLECICLDRDNTIALFKTGNAFRCKAVRRAVPGDKVFDAPGPVVLSSGSEVYAIGADAYFYRLKPVPIEDQIRSLLAAGEYRNAFGIAENESQLPEGAWDAFIQSHNFNAVFYLTTLVRLEMRARVFATDRPDVLEAFVDCKITNWVVPADFVVKLISTIQHKAKLDEFLMTIKINGFTAELIASAVEHELFGFVKQIMKNSTFVELHIARYEGQKRADEARKREGAARKRTAEGQEGTCGWDSQ